MTSDGVKPGLLWIILLVALGLRVIAYPLLHEKGYTSDEKEYIHLGSAVAGGGKFLDTNGEYSMRSPLFPLMLGGLFGIAGPGLTLAHLLNCVLGVLVVFLCYVLSMEVFQDQLAALCSALCASFYPGLVVYSVMLQTETLYMVFFLGLFLVVYTLWEKPTLVDCAALGILAGLAVLTRAVFLGFFPLIVAILWLRWKREGVPFVREAAVMVALFLVTLAPWTLRNYSIHGTLVPVSSWGGHSLLIGNNPYATGTWSTKAGFEEWYTDRLHERGISSAKELTEVERGAVARSVAIDYMLSHPVDVAALALKKAHIFLVYPITNSDSNIRLQAIAIVADVVLLSLAAVGIVGGKTGRISLLPVVLAVGFFTLFQILLHAEARYRLPLVPFACLIAGAGAASLLDVRQRRILLGNRRGLRTLGMFFGGIAVVYAYTGLMFLTGSIS